MDAREILEMGLETRCAACGNAIREEKKVNS